MVQSRVIVADHEDMQAESGPLPVVPIAPDLPAPVHAFRDWRVGDEGLTSPRAGVLWSTRVMRAECRPRTPEDLVRPPHRPPGQDCNCGIRAYFRPSRETSRIDYAGVTGVVSVWGAVAVHADGLRAEFARVEALGVYDRWTRRQKSAVERVAGELGVDLVPLEELEQRAHGYAGPMPAVLIPSRPARRARRRVPAGSAPLVIVEP
jgi:hypothetical protein